ncbi:recombinase XerD [Bacillus licheniformis]|uniref:Tyrosine-type recombinase/integrase n=2 Tax=Bacillati TaxID=1783272 RepID=A0AAW6KFX2_9BACI|nr:MULTISPECIES: tyrosine-type recombinase/integrase [Bacillus]KAA0807282.1 recombinase XerD [Bacillus licheniformis]KAA0819753.1 recombinase XerD [Bacillus licheniformis]KAA0820743.1 recombinase XerD [Bacillus licheniformis]MBC9090148.1 tyrosine-type recombinase/integrase [Bacillus sp. Y1]MBS2764194.1 tyrosine-type recombinase/integrase [Bacillus licheniformis]
MARRSNKLITDQATDKPEIELTDFETAFNSFIRECKLKNLSKHTVKYYRDELLAFRTMLERQGISTKPGDMTLKIIKENVIVYMMETLNRKETSINTRLRAIRAFFNFLEKDRQIYENPVRELSLLKQKKEVVETFSRDQLKDLLRQPDLGTFTGFRDYTIMLLLIETGVRVRELTDICVKDIRWEDSQIRIDGKGYKERLVPIQATMKRQLRKYVQIRGDVPNEALFVTIDNTPLTIRQVQNRLRKYGRKANIKNVRCSPHTFRHTFAKMSVQNGADVFALQAVLGHTSLDMVRNYVNLFSSDVMDAHKKFSPVEKLF